MHIRKNRDTGQYYNSWKEGDKLYVQNLKTGRTTEISKKQQDAKVYQVTDNFDGARRYANGE